jgi:NtrC-family two-component system response regulator AlgB
MDILIVDDEKIIRDATSLLVEKAGHYAETASNSAVALESLKESSFDLVLLDMNLGDENGMDVLERILQRHPNQPVVMFTAASTIETAVEAMRRGALDYLQKPFNVQHFNIVLARVQKHRRLAERVTELETQISTQTPDPTFESITPSVVSVMNVLFRAAPTPASILLLGESGTGKSVAARAVCKRSHLRDKPFITVSCPSLSRELLESDLFGHVKGAFTGAVKDHWGKVKAAEGGTLFLDEIGELPMEIQPKLLRLLQEREYERLGENVTRRAEVRVIAATNRDLPALIRAGQFREDLYYRLNVISVTMPALRERPQDIEQHAHAYATHFAAQCGRRIDGFSKCGRAALLSYPWPGNLRELRNAIERAVILCADTQITAEDLPYASGGSLSEASFLADKPAIVPGAHVTLEDLEVEHIQRIVASSASLQEAAEILGIDQATLYRKRKKLSLKD